MIKQLTAKEMTVVGGVGSEYLAQIAEWVSYYIADRGCKLLEQNQVMLGLFKQYPLIEAGFPVGFLSSLRVVAIIQKKRLVDLMIKDKKTGEFYCWNFSEINTIYNFT